MDPRDVGERLATIEEKLSHLGARLDVTRAQLNAQGLVLEFTLAAVASVKTGNRDVILGGMSHLESEAGLLTWPLDPMLEALRCMRQRLEGALDDIAAEAALAAEGVGAPAPFTR